jgi:hypothetical protein
MPYHGILGHDLGHAYVRHAFSRAPAVYAPGSRMGSSSIGDTRRKSARQAFHSWRVAGTRSLGGRITPPSRKVSRLPTVKVVNREWRRRALPGHDDHDLARRLREERVEASEESTPPEASEESTPPEASEESPEAEASEELTPAEARWILKVGLVLVLLAGVAAFSGVGTVSNGLRGDVLAALEKVRDSSTAALDSSTEALRSVVGASVGKVGAIASNVGAVPSALGGDVVGALQQARDSSAAALRSAVGEPPSKHFQTGSDQPFRKQYGSNVSLCLPNVHDVSITRSVSARSVPSLVAKGAIYPVPASGCP